MESKQLGNTDSCLDVHIVASDFVHAEGGRGRTARLTGGGAARGSPRRGAGEGRRAARRRRGGEGQAAGCRAPSSSARGHRAPCPWPKHAAARRSPPASSQPAPLLPQLRRRQRPSAPSLPLQSCSPSSSVAQGGSRQPRPWGRRRTSTSHGEEGGGRPPMGEKGDLDRPWRISPAGRRW